MNSWAFVMLADSVNCTERELHLDTAKYKLNLSEKEAEEVYQKALSTLKVDDISREYEY